MRRSSKVFEPQRTTPRARMSIMSKAKHSFVPLSPWADRFNVPTIDHLVAGLSHPAANLFKHTRKMLRDVGLGVESVAWHGESWKWTIEFRAFPNAERPIIVVPAPDNLQLAMPLTREFIQMLPMRRLKKAVREGLELASEPFDTHLAIWSLSTVGQVADLQDLLHRRVRHAAKKTG